MVRKTKRRATATTPIPAGSYETILTDVVGLLETARRASARSVNAVMTATYWLIGRRIVEHEQHGRERAEYGETLIRRLATDLAARFGRGFGRSNLFQIRAFYLQYADIIPMPPGGLPRLKKVQTASGLFKQPFGPRTLSQVAVRFPLPWSHYARLLTVKNPHARAFYEAEALRGGWSIRQLNRQIGTMFYERAALSRNKTAMLRKGEKAQSQDTVTPEQELKDPFVLEFLGLKDEYSESELEARR